MTSFVSCDTEREVITAGGGLEGGTRGPGGECLKSPLQRAWEGADWEPTAWVLLGPAVTSGGQPTATTQAGPQPSEEGAGWAAGESGWRGGGGGGQALANPPHLWFSLQAQVGWDSTQVWVRDLTLLSGGCRTRDTSSPFSSRPLLFEGNGDCDLTGWLWMVQGMGNVSKTRGTLWRY